MGGVCRIRDTDLVLRNENCMKQRLNILAGLTFLLVPLIVTPAQEDAVTILEYYDSDLELQILDRRGEEQQFFPGFALSPGDRIVTRNTGVELRLEPSGSIVRIDSRTSVTLDSLQEREEALETAFTVESGWARIVASGSLENPFRYRIESRAAVITVTGTDIIVRSSDTIDEVYLLEGSVSVEERGTGEILRLEGGQGLILDGSPLQVGIIPPEDFQALEERLRFDTLDPALVARAVPPPASGLTPLPDPIATDEIPLERDDTPRETVNGEDPDRRTVFERIAERTDIHLGSATIENETWGNIVFLPRFQRGRFFTQLYIPVTYRINPLFPGDWYRPGGNNEWSFGSDQDWSGDTITALTDVGRDLALKIDVLQIGEPTDPVYLRIGSLSGVDFGPGLLVRNFGNDLEFPAIRRTGLLFTLDRETWGSTTLVSDLFDPAVIGNRFFFRPAAEIVDAVVGLSVVTDRSPASVIPGMESPPPGFAAAAEGKPRFLSVAADLTIPILDRGTHTLAGFGEAGGIIPTMQSSTSVDGRPVSSGLKTNALVDFETGELRNIGWTLGVTGRAETLSYRLQYLNYTGTFQPGLYGQAYDRNRGAAAAEATRYLANTRDQEFRNTTMALGGEVSFPLAAAGEISVGYTWPWEVSPGNSWSSSSNDSILFSFVLNPGILPGGFDAGVSYRRSGFLPTVLNRSGYKGSSLLDAETVVDGYVSYRLAPAVTISGRFGTTMLRDGSGDVQYRSDGRPRVAPTVILQTEIGLY